MLVDTLTQKCYLKIHTQKEAHTHNLPKIVSILITPNPRVTFWHLNAIKNLCVEGQPSENLLHIIDVAARADLLLLVPESQHTNKHAATLIRGSSYSDIRSHTRRRTPTWRHAGRMSNKLPLNYKLTVWFFSLMLNLEPPRMWWTTSSEAVSYRNCWGYEGQRQKE